MKTNKLIDKIISLLFLITILSKNIIAQNYHLAYDVVKDKHWIDSINSIVKKGFEYNEKDKNNAKKQLKYFNSCYELGKYYEILFDKKILPNNKKAIYYYEKVTDFGRFPDNEKYFKALSLRNVLCRRLAKIYFDGKGVKKNKDKSMGYALIGSSGYGYRDFFENYSMKYLGTKTIISQDGKYNYYKDSIIWFTINPFAINCHRLKIAEIKLELTEIAKAFKYKVAIDTSYKIYIEGNSQTSMKSQALTFQILHDIKKYLINHEKIFGAKVFLDISTTNVPAGTFRISFTKQNLVQTYPYY